MSTRTYFAHPGRNTVFVSVDHSERARLRRRGWRKVYRDEAVRLMNGLTSFRFALAVCRTGEIETPPHAKAVCWGHDASTQ